jgi:hypothetical protein
MYVRWKKRKSIDKHPEHHWQKASELTYSAELVESTRINGKPRQKVLAFLGSIKHSELANVTARFYFWHTIVTKKMQVYPLYELTDEQQRMIFAALHQLVPLKPEEFTQELERTKHIIGFWSMPRFWVVVHLNRMARSVL